MGRGSAANRASGLTRAADRTMGDPGRCPGLVLDLLETEEPEQMRIPIRSCGCRTKLVAGLCVASVAACALASSDRVSDLIRAGDMAAIKQKADAGDAAAQVVLGTFLARYFLATEALEWYSKAAAQGNVQGQYTLGHILLFGNSGTDLPPVRANPAEGIRWTFRAATNFHGTACWDMAKALRQGLGTSTNLVAAYAWLKLFSETAEGSVLGRVEMNELALKMDTASLQQAMNLVAQFKAGNWQAPPARAIADGDPRLKLNGITFGTQHFALINGKTLAEGESATIPVKPLALTLKCLRIEKDSVLISVEGEDQPRLLRLK